MWTRSPDGRLYRRCSSPLIWVRSQYRTPYGRLHRNDVRDVNLDSSATSYEGDDGANWPVFVIMELDNPTDKDGSIFFLDKEDDLIK